MNIDISFEVLEEIIQFVSDNNIAQTEESKKNAAKVVQFVHIERHLKFSMPTAFEILERNYSNLYSFLMEKGRQVVREEWNNRLKYEVMTLQRYKNDKRFNTGYFPELKRDLHQGSNLFVIYLLDNFKKIHGPIKEYYLITESLTDQIALCCEQHFLPLRSYLIRNDIRDRVNAMVQEVFSGTQATVELIGSSHTQLAMAESDVNLGIRIPKHMVTADAYLCNSSNWTESVYDVHFLAQSLREMGMVAPFPIPLAKICKFVDPASRLNCAVGVDTGLVFERDHLIAEYLKLDKRVRPLISAILYFTRSQNINKSLRMGQLSTYSYIIMVLHFLMCKLNRPVIPSLQDLYSDCSSPECFYNRNHGLVPSFFDNKIENIQVRFHDCVRVENRKTNVYSTFDSDDTDGDNQYTPWYSDNNDNLGSLFIDFLDYFSVKKNFKRISIICDDGDLVNAVEKDWRQYYVGIQDPFFTKKNIARNIKYHGLDNVVEIFSSAAHLLRKGGSFQDICEM